MKEIIEQYLEKHGFERFAPRAVLFDMDGVLYNSMPNHAEAWQKSMEFFHINMTAADAYATEGARGIDTIRMMVKKQQGRDISLEEAQSMYDVKTRYYHSMKPAEIFEGVIPLMQKIKDDGMQICVVTGSGQRPLLNRLLVDFGEFLCCVRKSDALLPLSVRLPLLSRPAKLPFVAPDTLSALSVTEGIVGLLVKSS